MASQAELLAELHRERVARLPNNKRERERSISPPASRKAPKLEQSTATLPSGAKLSSFTSIVKSEQQGRKTDIANQATEKLKASTTASTTSVNTSSSSSHRQGDIIYPQGVVKKTWAFQHDHDGQDIKLEEVLEPQTLQTAMLSAFQWDMDWVFSKLKTPLDGGTTKCVFVMQAKEASLKEQLKQNVQGSESWLRLCFPPMDGQTHCMHSKLMLLFHPKKLRVAVPSANLLSFDWGEAGVMENSVFIIDLPRLPEASAVKRDEVSEFGKELLYFLDKQGLDKDIKDAVLKFDFTATQRIAFVHSIGGVSAGEDADHSGLAALSRAVRQLNLQSSNVGIDFAASSIGNLKDTQLSLLHAAACGDNVFEYTTKVASKKAANFFTQASVNDHGIRDRVRIYFPTQETVQTSTAGAAGTICLSREWFEDVAFPRRCFRDYISTRPGLLSHNKIMYVQSPQEQEGKKVAWVYVGSANMSESAWGKLVYSKKDKTWHVNCRNWETGVLLPVELLDDQSKAASDLTIFDEVLKPPFLHPAPIYEGRDPWYFKELHES